MKAKSFLFILTAVIMSFLMIACGEETDSGSIDQNQKGTLLNRDLMRRGRVSSFSGEAIRHKAKLPPLNAQTWQTPATGLTTPDSQCRLPGSLLPHGMNGRPAC